MELKKNEFNKLIEYGTLISIDLIIENKHNQILLGLRKNRPAKDSWFVPGGRILKNESEEEAFQRITKKELGIKLNINNAVLIDIYSHLYPHDNSNDVSNVDTHYIVLAYYVKFELDISQLPIEQHAEYKWFCKNEVDNVSNIHKNVRPYFDITMHGNININHSHPIG